MLLQQKGLVRKKQLINIDFFPLFLIKEAQKRDKKLLMFPLSLGHVAPAARSVFSFTHPALQLFKSTDWFLVS